MSEDFWQNVAETIAARAALVRKKDLERLEMWRDIAVACAILAITLGVALCMSI